MKLKNILMLLALALGTFTFVACGDDEEQQPQDQGQTSNANQEVVGIYTGWTNLKTTYLDRNYSGDTLAIAPSDGGTLTAIFKDSTWGIATITGIQASLIEAGEGYKLEGGVGQFVMNNIRTGGTQTFACKLENATISADKKQMTAVISAYMEVGHGDMTFTFQTGEMPTEE